MFSLPEDLQAEISEIDDDIANMQEQLGISDTSNTSISEEKYVSAATDQQRQPDSPEFWSHTKQKPSSYG